MGSWVNQQHALSPESIDAIQRALDLGWVVGFHYYFGAGRGPDAVAFADLEDYRTHVQASRPGDKFVLWSVGTIVSHGLALASFRSTDNDVSKKTVLSSLEAIRNYLEVGLGPKEIANEVLVAAKAPNEARPKALVTDIDGMEDIEEIAASFDSAGGEMYALPLEAIEKREWCLLNVKRANEKGEIPSVGAY